MVLQQICTASWNLRFSGMLRSIYLYYVTNVSGQPIGPIFKGQAVQEECCLILEDGTDRLSRNVVTYYKSTPCDIPEEWRSQLHRGGSLRSCRPISFYKEHAIKAVLAKNLNLLWKSYEACSLNELGEYNAVTVLFQSVKWQQHSSETTKDEKCVQTDALFCELDYLA